MEDCYYFLYSSCTKEKCFFRHSASAKKNLILCKQWSGKKKCTPECPLRHSDYHLRKGRKDMLCYWEDMESGCQKEFCDFKHRNTQKDEWKRVKIKTLDEIKRTQCESPARSLVTSEAEKITDKIFVPKTIKKKEEAGTPLSLKNDELESAEIEKELEMIDKMLEEEGLDMRDIRDK